MTMNDKYYVTEEAEGGYWKAVKPKWDKPKRNRFSQSHKEQQMWEEEFEEQVKEWQEHIASLPEVFVHPSFKVKAAGDWIEGVEGYECLSMDGITWVVCSKYHYDCMQEQYRRIVLLPSPTPAINSPVVADENGTIIEFLLGEKSYNGLWFGDKQNNIHFWWRKELREYASQFTVPANGFSWKQVEWLLSKFICEHAPEYSQKGNGTEFLKESVKDELFPAHAAASSQENKEDVEALAAKEFPFTPVDWTPPIGAGPNSSVNYIIKSRRDAFIKGYNYCR